jgi:hypothetical protein
MRGSTGCAAKLGCEALDQLTFGPPQHLGQNFDAATVERLLFIKALFKETESDVQLNQDLIDRKRKVHRGRE